MDPVGILVAVVLHPLGEGYQPAPELASIAAPLEPVDAADESERPDGEPEDFDICAEWNSPGHGIWAPGSEFTPEEADVVIGGMDAYCNGAPEGSNQPEAEPSPTEPTIPEEMPLPEPEPSTSPTSQPPTPFPTEEPTP